jgi:hypothetical protein
MSSPPAYTAVPAAPHAHGLELTSLDISDRAITRNVCDAIDAAGRDPNRGLIRQMIDTIRRTGYICDPNGRYRLRGDIIIALSKPRASDPRRDGWRQR